MIGPARSFLFVPGDRPERFDKAAASGADVVVLDLEDAVAPDAKEAALGHVVAWLAAGHRAAVRVTAVGTPTHGDQVAALAGTGAPVVLAKAETTEQIDDVVARLRGGPLVALVETPVGVRDVDAIASAPGVARLALGTIDLAAELGVDPAVPEAFAYARGRLAIASAAAGLPGPVDGVTTRLDDPDLLDADLAISRTHGFTAKLCIHPRQVGAVNDAFTPSAEEVAWADRVVAAAEADPSGVVVVDGAMVDAPVVTRARRLLSLHPPMRGS